VESRIPITVQLSGLQDGTELPMHPVFTALHVMQTRYGEENSVCLSVCLSVRPSVARVIRDKTEERSVQILYHTKEHLS